MKTTSKETGNGIKNLGLMGIGLCALCCALPIIGIAGGAGILASIALYAEKIVLALLIISTTLFGIWLYRRKKTPACSVNCSCKVESANSKIGELNTK